MEYVSWGRGVHFVFCFLFFLRSTAVEDQQRDSWQVVMYRGLICLLVLISGQGCYGSSRLEEWEVTLHHGIEKRRGGQPVVEPPRHSAGYMNLTNTHGARLFYYYAQDRYKNPDAPLVFWTNGGPGDSSMDGAFGVHGAYGPFDITKNFKLKYNEWGWDKGHNVLFIDQPVGVGFSYSTDSSDNVNWSTQVGEHMLEFFLEFMELHPELRERKLFLTGISYAGHYVPAIAAAILESNKEGRNMHLNLAGVQLGSPGIYGFFIFTSMAAYALENGLISQEMAADMSSHISDCAEKSRECNWKDTLDREQYNRCVDAEDYCAGKFLTPIIEANPGLDIYNISNMNSQLDFSNKRKEEGKRISRKKYLNLPKVQKQLGVHKKWMRENDTVHTNMAGDRMRDMTPDVITLLNNGIRFMVFTGDQDLIINWIGIKDMFAKMQWNLASTWKNELKSWSIDMSDWGGDETGITTLGECEVLEPLTNCVIFNGGHRVEAKPAYIIMKTFVSGKEFVPPDTSPFSEEAEHSRKEFFAAA